MDFNAVLPTASSDEPHCLLACSTDAVKKIHMLTGHSYQRAWIGKFTVMNLI